MFQVKPIGTGRDVESFYSFLLRASQRHGVRFKRLYYHLKSERGATNTPANVTEAVAGYWVRPNTVNKNIVRMLSDSFSAPLEHTYFWFGGLSGTVHGLVDDTLRWCPECLADWQRAAVEPYYKLSWFLKDASHCTAHRTPLISECAACGRSQNSSNRSHDFGRCRMCGHSLARRKSRLQAKDMRHSWSQSPWDVEQLLDDIAHFGGDEIAFSGLQGSLLNIVSSFLACGNIEELYATVGKNIIADIVVRGAPKDFLAVRQLAYRLGIPLFDLWTGRGGVQMDLFPLNKFCPIPSTRGIGARAHRTQCDDIQENLDLALQADAPVISKRELARSLGVSVGFLDHRFPDRTAQLVARRRAHLQKKRLADQARAQQLALNYFRLPENTVRTLSRKAAYRQLRKETGLPKWVLKNAINNAYKMVSGG